MTQNDSTDWVSVLIGAGAVMCFCFVLSVMCIPPTSAANVYHDCNPANDTSLADVTGGAIFFDRACGSAEDLTIFISRDGTNVTAFDSYYHPDRTDVPGQNPGYLSVKILSDCNSAIERLTPGNYTAYLRNGNGGQPETQHFIIAAGSTETVPFLGHAVSSKHVYPTGNRLEILRATWGAGQVCYQEWVEEVNHTLHHNGTVETIYHGEQNHTVYHQEINHTIWIEEVNHTITYPEVGHTEYRTLHTDCFYTIDERYFGPILGWKVLCTNPEHSGWHVQTPECTERKVTYGEWGLMVPDSCTPSEGLTTVIGCPTCRYEIRTVVDVPTHTEIVVDIPAHTETAVDVPAWQEIVVDVPAWVETRIIAEPYDEVVVDVPGHWETICRTGHYIDVTNIVRGLVKGGELHVKAVDYVRLFGNPAPGIEKLLTIEYTLNGIDGVYSAGENTDVNIPEA